MNVKPIRDPVAGEQVVGAQPRLTPTAEDAGWQRRLNLYTGRALGESALTLEQQGRAGRLAMAGRAWSHGVAAGLEVGLEAQATSRGETRWLLHIAAGYGLTARGEDVYLPRNLRVDVDELHAYLPARILPPTPEAVARAQAEQEARRKALEQAQAEADAAAEAERAALAARMRAGTDSVRRLSKVLGRGKKTGEGGMPEPAEMPDPGEPTPEQVRAAALRLPLDPGIRQKVIDALKRDEDDPIGVWQRGSMVKPLLPASTPEDIREGGVPVGAGMPLRRPTVVMGGLSAKPLGTLRDSVRLPRVAILLLQPVEAELVGRPDPQDPCELDPQDDAFADWQVADGVRVVLYAFPWEDRVDATPAATWRNRLAYEVFAAEAALGPGERLPWEYEGLPIGLVGFDGHGAPAWVDGYAVVRDGGRPHRRTPLLQGVGDAYLWQARLKQFAEQVAEVDWSTAVPKEEFKQFAYLPPAGLLPRTAVDLERNETWAFPEDYVVEAVPVPLEQLDAAIEASAPLEPFDLRRPDRVRVLVPVPQAYYEPRLLHDDAVDPQFGEEITELGARREDLLLRREDLRRKAEALVEAVTGTRPDFGRGERDPDRLEENEGVSVPVPRFGGRAHESPLDPERPGLNQHYFESAQPILVAPGEVLYVWAYRDPAHPPRALMLQWKDGANLWDHRAVWGDETVFPWGVPGTISRRRMGDLPRTGDWVRLEIPAHRVGLENVQITGMAFGAFAGRVFWDRAGRLGSTDRVWLDDGLPDRAVQVGTFTWAAANPAPFSGTKARQVPAAAGLHQHFFYSASAGATLRVERGDTLFAYVWLDPANPPKQVMLQFNDGSWEHRAYWGDNRIGWGVEGTASRRRMGDLPPLGRWVRLEVPASAVGLEGRVLNGMAFTLFDGRAAWDRAGRATPRAAARGTGLRGEYYGAKDFTALVMTRLDPRVEFNWGAEGAAPGVGPDGFSVRWTGYVVPPYTEEYTFYTNTDDGARLWVDGRQLVNDWTIHALRGDADELNGKVFLEGGRKYRVVMEYFEDGQVAAAFLKWSSPNLPKQVIPEWALFPPGTGELAETDRPELRWVDDALPPGATAGPVDVNTGPWTWIGMPTLAPAEDDFGTRLDGEEVRVEALAALQADLAVGPLLPDELDGLGRTGLEPFVQALDARVRRADDHVDFSFLRVQSDIYRLRQLMLGTTSATRLATSPALANIINSESALTVRDQLLGYLQSVKATGTAATAPQSRTSQDAPAARKDAESTNLLVANTYFMKANTLNLGWNVGAIGTAMSVAAKAQPAAAAAPVAVSSVVGMDTPFRAARYMGYTPVTRKPAAAEAVRLKAPIVGEAYDFRTVTVAERLESPAANEAKSFAVLSRYEVLQGLAGLDVPLDDVMIPGFIKRDAGGIPEKRTLKNAVPGGPAPSGGSFVWVREARRFGEVKNRLEALVLEENDPANADESAFFSMAVELLDATVAALRNVEGRIQQYRGAVDRARAALDELHALAARVDARLKTVGDDLAETRHDLAVARALLEDEKARVAAVNARRRRILAEQVHFYAYQRPRLSAALLDAPARPLDPAFTQSPLPAALAGSDAAPAELRAIVEVLREAPLRFFRNASNLLAGLDTLAVLRGTLESARERARVKQSPVTLDALDRRLDGRLGASIARTLQAQAQVVMLHRQAAAQMDLGSFGVLNWARVRAEALRTLSLGDLIDAAHGRTAVDRAAAREVDDVLKVATAFYREIGQVKPAIRLDWAESLSQYDQAADLHNLYALPRFGEIEYLDRREMQALVDWLYARIDPAQPEAAAMMSDVVRVCILLASHAPVNAVLAASVPRETEVRIGGTVEVAADTAHARVGMHVLLYDVGKRPVHAVVEDLTDQVVVARVVHAAAPSVTIAKDTRAQLGEEARLATHAAVAAGKPKLSAPTPAKK